MSGDKGDAESLQVVVFSLLNEASKKTEDYGIEVEFIREIRPTESITRLPRAPTHVKGITNLRGKIIPVVDLKQRLGFASSGEPGADSRILVAETAGATTGLLVDRVEQVIRLPAKDVDQSAPELLQRGQFLKGIAKTEGRLLILLDAEKLLEDVGGGTDVARKA